MTAAQDFLSLLTGCIGIFATSSRGGFVGIVTLGVILAALCWWACSRFSRLWNLKYRIVLLHHILCFIAATVTLVFTVVFFALQFAKESADASVQIWEAQINSEHAFSNALFAKCWHQVKDAGLEDFTNVPPPGSANSIIPLSKDSSIRLVATIYTKGSLAHFTNARPFLSKIITAKLEVPQRKVDADVKAFFAAHHPSYPLQRSISLAAREIKSQLQSQLPRVVSLFRTWEIVLFFLVQLFPFGLVAIAAYTSLKVTTTSDYTRVAA